MANTETINILRVDGTQAVTTLRELKAAIEADKDALVQLGLVEDGDVKKKEQQAAIIKKLEADLKLLNQVQQAGKVTTVENAKAIDTQTASYYDLQKALSTLKKAWKDMTAEERASAEGGEILQKIKQLDAELKTLDADIGQYQRNVGNYGQTFAQSLDQAQKGAQGLTQGFSAVNGIMALTGDQSNALTKTLAAMQIVVGLLNSAKGITGFLKNLRSATKEEKAATAATKAQTGAMVAEEAATKGATLATKAFKTALVSTGIGALIIAVGELIAHLGDLADVFGLTDEEAARQHEAMLQRLEDLDAEFDKQQKLLEASGVSHGTALAEEVKALQNLAHEAYDTYSKLYDEYNDMYLVEQWASDLSDDKIAEIYEKHLEYIDKIKEKYVELEAGVVSYVHSADLERAQEGMADYEKSIDNLKRTAMEAADELEALRLAGQITADDYETYSKQIVDTFNWQLQQVVQKEKDRIAAEKKRAAERAAAERKRNEERIAAERERNQAIADAAADYFKSDEQKLTEKYRADIAKLEKFGIDTTDLTAKYQKELSDIVAKESAEREKTEREAAEKAQKAVRDAADAQLEVMQQLADQRARRSAASIDDDEKAAAASFEIEMQSYRDRIAALQQFQQEALTLGDQEAALQYQQEAADLSVEIELREAEEKQRIRQRDKKNREQAAKETVASVSSILGALADIYESNGKNDVKAQRKAKNLRIAAATIDMIQGAVTAYSTAQSLGPIAGPIVGAINAAAVTAAGLANIAKIRKTDVSGASDAGETPTAPAIVEAPTVQPEVNVVRNLTSASEEDRLNQMAAPSRVYILQSDIEAAGNRSKVQTDETTF